MNKKLTSINYLRCIACLLIINSHLFALYPARLSRLAWGGYFGNNIFFFVSGYCLVKIDDNFWRWYRKRFMRVYIPYAISIPLLYFAGSYEGYGAVEMLVPFKLYHFIPTILTLYIGYYVFLRLRQRGIKLEGMIATIVAVMFLYFYLIYDYNNGDLYAHFSVLEMLSYLVTILLGAAARFRMDLGKKTYRFIGIITTVSCFLLYSFQSVVGFPKYLSLFQLFIGIGFAYGIGNLLIDNESRLIDNRVIILISKVTLEAYIVHYICIDAYKTVGFPTNLIFFIISAMAIAYCLNIITTKVLTTVTGMTVHYTASERIRENN